MDEEVKKMEGERKTQKIAFEGKTIFLAIIGLVVGIGFVAGVSGSLISRYSMNATSGTDVVDSYSPYEHAEFGSPAPSWGNWESGTIYGIEFSGGSQYTAGEFVNVVDDDGDYEFSSPFRIRARIWLDSDCYSYNMIFAKYLYESSVAYGYQFRIVDGYLRFTIYDGDASPINVYSTITVPEETWIRVVCDYDPVYGNIGVYYYYTNEGDKLGANSNSFDEDEEIVYDDAMPDATIGRNSDDWGGYTPFMGRMDALEIETYT